MSTITVYDNGMISLDGKDTGLSVSQRAAGTVLYRREMAGQNTQEISLPHRRYALSCDNPASGNPGRLHFVRDLLSILDESTGR